jgi:hypothetical protein
LVSSGTFRFAEAWNGVAGTVWYVTVLCGMSGLGAVWQAISKQGGNHGLSMESGVEDQN